MENIEKITVIQKSKSYFLEILINGNHEVTTQEDVEKLVLSMVNCINSNTKLNFDSFKLKKQKCLFFDRFKNKKLSGITFYDQLYAYEDDLSIFYFEISCD